MLVCVFLCFYVCVLKNIGTGRPHDLVGILATFYNSRHVMGSSPGDSDFFSCDEFFSFATVLAVGVKIVQH